MKKLLTLALVALGFTAAQAVTFNWTANLTNNSGDAQKPGWCGIIVAAGEVSRDTFGAFKDYMSDNPHTSGSYTFTNPTAVTFAHVASVVMDTETGATYAEVKGSSTGYQITSAVDVTGLDAISFLYFNESWGHAQAIQVTGLGDISEDVTYDLGTWNFNNGGDQAVTVPEPTALALLALGVAGLALKRKVA